MAADQTAVKIGTGTLVAATNYKINLTRPNVTKVELVNHGTDVVYYGSATTEAGLPTLAGGGADEEKALLGGERLTLWVGRVSTGPWVILRSAGTPTVSVEALN